MLINAGGALPPIERHWDVLIVGAGAVGLTLGITLARQGRSVVILEGGPVQPAADYQRRNLALSTGLPHRGLLGGRMKALGGTTRLWGGQLVPFGPRDFAGNPALNVPPWPVTYADLQESTRQAFAFVGLDEAATDQEAIWRRATGLPSEFGSDLQLGMNIWLPQPDFAQLFAKEIRSLPSLSVITDAQVVDLLPCQKGTAVAGVEVRRPDGSTAIVRGNRVVLANGTFEVVASLLRAGSCHPEFGFAGNPFIGRYYIDHLHGLIGRVDVKDQRSLSRMFDNIYFGKRKYGVKIRTSETFRTRTGIANCAATLNATLSPGILVRDFAGLARRMVAGGSFRHAGSFVRQGVAMSRIMLPLAWRYLVERRSTSLMSGGIALGVEVEQIPTERSYLALDPAASPRDAQIVLNWALDGREIDAIAETGEALDRSFRERGLGSIDLDPRVVARDPEFLLTCHDSNHQMGGARMAIDASLGVVDGDLRVFGMDNLFVLGAAVFPSGSFANPTLTAMAFAIRLADHLQRQPARAVPIPEC